MNGRRLALLAGAVIFAAIALAIPALADSLSCERTTTPDGFSLACKAAVATPVPTPTPTTPTQPPAPPAGPAQPPADEPCPPGQNWLRCVMERGNPVGPSSGSSAPSSPSGGGGFDRLAFDFRDGDSLRIVGGGTRTAVATRSAVVHFSVGDMGGNVSSERRVTVSVNGQVVEDVRGVYVVTRDVPVRAGDTIAVTVTGEGNVVANARIAVS